MQIRHPDIAKLGLLIPNVDDVIARPHAVWLAQAHAFTDARHSGKTDPVLCLVRLVLDFDFNHFTEPLVSDQQR